MVKIVTDSVSDIPPEVASELDITVIPLNVHFGTETYRDGIDLSRTEFYEKLQSSSVLPKTSSAPPALFAEVFDRLAETTGEIFAVFLSHKFSTTWEVARQGIELMKSKCRVEVIDSTLAAMGQGLLVIEMARLASSGASLDRLKNDVAGVISRIQVRATLDTLKYLAMGGRAYRQGTGVPSISPEDKSYPGYQRW